MSNSLSRDVKRFRKRPVIVEAVQYRPHENCAEVSKFMGLPHNPDACLDGGPNAVFLISTLEGMMECRPGDWIIRGVKGEFYPCKPDIFESTYEPA